MVCLISVLFSGPVEVPAVEFGEGDISTEAETRRQRMSRSARISRLLVPLARSLSGPVDFSGRDHSRALLEQAFDDGWYQVELRNCLVASHGVSSFHCSVSDHFSADPAITPINATGHQLVSLCRSVCAEERAQILDPIVTS